MQARYVTTNGIRLHLVEEGRGPLVLLLHGWPEFWWSWRHQLPALAAAGYRAAAVDLPGYHLSDKPDVTYDEAWVNTCLAGLVPALGHERCVIVGHDWGGLLVWPFARRFPELTAGVVGLNTPDFPRGPLPPVELMRRIFPDQPPYIVQFQEYGPAEYFLGSDVEAWLRFVYLGAAHRPEVFTDEVIARYVEVFSVAGSVTPPLEYYRNLDRNWELRADLPDRIAAPALVLSARHDPVLRPEMVAGMQDRVADLTTVVIEDCGHWTQQERPEETNRHLLAFLDRLPRW
ncbi:MAG: alpha/beta fold hydrolase [Acidimicrobiales bacterium]